MLKNILLTLLITSMFSYLHSGDGKTYKVKTDSRGVKTFYNKNKPADPNFKIELKKIGVITPDYLDSLDAYKFHPYDFNFDNFGNLIILDHNRMWKFTKNFRYMNKWSREGYGPGEFGVPFHFFILNDTIYVINGVPKKIIKFDINGKYINDIHQKYSDIPDDIFFVNNEYLLGAVGKYDPEKKRNTDKIVMYDSKTFEIKKKLFEREMKKESDWAINYFIYAGNEKVFFVVDNSFNDYKINCYDSATGNLKYKIRKSHIKVKNKKKAKKHYGVLDGKKVKIKSGTSKFKESINDIFYDKYDRLWVSSNNRNSEEEASSMYFDIFKDGVFLNRIKLDLNYTNIHRFKLTGNRIVQYGLDCYVDVYEF